jgi:hypothetical protein
VSVVITPLIFWCADGRLNPVLSSAVVSVVLRPPLSSYWSLIGVFADLVLYSGIPPSTTTFINYAVVSNAIPPSCGDALDEYGSDPCHARQAQLFGAPRDDLQGRRSLQCHPSGHVSVMVPCCCSVVGVVGIVEGFPKEKISSFA